MGEAFRFKTPSSILIVGPSGCGKTCFTESLLLDHLEELFANPPPKIHDAGIQFHEGVPTPFHLQKWFPKGGLLVLDDPDPWRPLRQKSRRRSQRDLPERSPTVPG